MSKLPHNLTPTDDEVLALDAALGDGGPTLQSYRERIRETAEKIRAERAADRKSKA